MIALLIISMIGIVSGGTTVTPLLSSDIVIDSDGVFLYGDVAFDGTHYLSVWSDKTVSTTGSTYSVSGRFIDVNGVPYGSSFTINPSYANDIAVAFNGQTYLVTYIGRNEYYDNTVYGNYVDVNGNVGPKILIATDSNSISNVDAISDGTGFLLVWDQYIGSPATNEHIYGQFLTSSEKSGSPFIISNTDVRRRWNPTITYGGGNYLVVWMQAPWDNSQLDIYGARVSPSGMVLDPLNFGVSTAPNGQGWGWMKGGASYDGTNYLVGWQDYRNSKGYAQIFGTRISPSTGALLDGPSDTGGKLIAEYSGGCGPNSLQIEYDSNNWLVVWAGCQLNGTRVTSDFTVLDPNGLTLSVNYPYKSQWNPSLVYGSGQYFVTWNREVSSGEYNLNGQILQEIALNAPPVANANGPYTGTEGGAGVVFSAAGSSDPEGAPLTYRWDFNNDGVYDITTTQETQTWDWAGNEYHGDVKLEVSDGTLTAMDTARVDINNVAPTTNILPIPTYTLTAGADIANTGKIFDGDFTTKWMAASGDPNAQWIKIDLGSVRSIAGFRETSGVYAGKPYTATVSTDDVMYTSMTSGTLTQWAFGEHLFTTSQDARYIKINIAQNDGYGVLAEFRVIETGILTSAIEDESIAFTGIFTDPGIDQWTSTWAFGDGQSASANVISGTHSLTGSHAYTTAGTYTVTLRVGDADGGVGTDQRTIVITPKDTTPPGITVPPSPVTPDPDGSVSVQVGDAVSATYTINDASAVTVTPDNGVITIPGFTDDGTYTVVVTATDAAGNTATDTFTVVIDKTAPIVTVPEVPVTPDPDGSVSVQVGDAVSATYTINDASAVTVTPDNGMITIPGFTDDGTYTVVVTATDAAGNTATDTFTVTISQNHAPVLTSPGDKTVESGSTLTFMLFASDEDGDTLTFSAPTLPSGASLEAATGRFSWTPASTQIGNHQVQFTVSDHDLSDSESITITVTDVAPTDNEAPVIQNMVANPNPVPINTPITLTATVDDSGTGNSGITSVQYSTDSTTWEAMSATDGIFDEPIEEVTATIAGFDTASVHTIAVTVTDSEGNIAQSEEILLAVYDPSAGFVTGGGWIMSPEGAYTPDPAMTGKATFGFVSKYKKGATLPTGETEFQFKAGNLNFMSTSYEWLVVAGAKAMYKGTGTINGAGEYGFMLTAIDGAIKGGGGMDKFRIKIWEKATDTPVYDNQLNAPDTDDPTTVISGGSIVIHTK